LEGSYPAPKITTAALRETMNPIEPPGLAIKE
jgi:hypothetical protein